MAVCGLSDQYRRAYLANGHVVVVVTVCIVVEGLPVTRL